MKILSLLFISTLISAAERMESVTREVSLMGTRCALTVYAKDRPRSLLQLEKLIRKLESTEQELSTWRKESALSRLNRWPVGIPFTADPNLCRLFPNLMYWVQETGRAFDPGVGALIHAWDIRNGGRLPTNSELDKALARSGLGGYIFDAVTCQITRLDDVEIDCGAFGKGEALDRLRFGDPQDVEGPWLVNLGGQIAIQGIPPGKLGWSVGIAHPNHREVSVFTIQLVSGSLATSGGSERNIQIEGRNMSHILDPRTGQPTEFSGSVSVWHESALVADILSTALYVMGPNEGFAWADARSLAACFLLESQKGIEAKTTQAFHDRFISTENIPVSKALD